MKEATIFIDLHGVLVNSSKMIKNYENILIQLYNKIANISREKAMEYHNSGLNLYLSFMEEIKNKKKSGNEFLNEMYIADKKWDELMQSFVPNTNNKDLESRNVEMVAGCYSDAFYEDGKELLFKLQNLQSNDRLDFFIVSNSHSNHIIGLLRGANILIPDSKILGWDKLKSLKNNKIFFLELLKYSNTKNNVIIGNSIDEMAFGKEVGFKTIFVDREYNKIVDLSFIDKVIQDLTNLLNELI
jgi:phosphoglycolate phosphatase-like HAD superfamily hydrolase